MQKLVVALFVIGSVLGTSEIQAGRLEKATESKALNSTAVVTLGHEVPFPLGTEIPFPWDSIEGVWHAKDWDVDTYFSFQINPCASDERILNVTQFDPFTGIIIAQGAGFYNKEERSVRAILSGDGIIYMVVVRAYHDNRAQTPEERTATVLTLHSFDPKAQDTHVILKKIDSRPIQNEGEPTQE